MTLAEAINIEEAYLRHHLCNRNKKGIEASQLSIEALKRTEARRERLSWKFEPLLPGETQE